MFPVLQIQDAKYTFEQGSLRHFLLLRFTSTAHRVNQTQNINVFIRTGEFRMSLVILSFSIDLCLKRFLVQFINKVLNFNLNIPIKRFLNQIRYEST